MGLGNDTGAEADADDDDDADGDDDKRDEKRDDEDEDEDERGRCGVSSTCARKWPVKATLTGMFKNNCFFSKIRQERAGRFFKILDEKVVCFHMFY